MTHLEIKDFRKKHSLTQEQLAEIVMVGVGTVRSWEQEQRNITSSSVKLMELYELNINKESYNVSVNRTKGDSLPLIPFDAVAGWSGVDNPGVSLDKLDRYVVPEFTSKGAEYIVRVSGSSMYPKYSNGDLLACRKVHDILFFQWGKIYVIDSSQGVMVKRIYEDIENVDRIICHSDNMDHYPKFSIPKSDIRSLSIVLGVIRME